MLTLVTCSRWSLTGFSNRVLLFFPLKFMNIWEGRYFEAMQKSCFTLNFHPLTLAIISRSYLQQLLLQCSGGDFPFCSFLSHLLEFFCKEKAFLPHLLIYLIIYLCRYDPTCMFISFSELWSSILTSAHIVPPLANGSSSRLASVSFDMTPPFKRIFSTFLNFWHNKIFILYFPCLTPGLYHFSKEPWFFIGEWHLKTKIGALGALGATRVSLLLDRARKYIDYMLTNVHMHTPTSIVR